MKERHRTGTTIAALLARLGRLYKDDSGQDIVEYALIAVSMGLFTVAGVHGLASSINNDITIIVNAFNNATSSAS